MSRRLPPLLVLLASHLFAPARARGEGPLFTESLAFDLELQDGESLVVGSLVTADFDGNGGEDVAGLSSSGVFVRLSDPDRTFLDPVVYAAGTGPVALAARDLDHDGFPDLVAANSGSSTLSVFLNRGDGSFEPADHIRVELGPRAISLEDFNRDGLVDVASGSYVDAVDILLGDGSGAFSRGQVLQTGNHNLHYIAAGDFDADSIPDLAVVCAFGLSWFEGIGDGRFASPVHTDFVAPGPNPHFITAADFLGDEKMDLALVGQEGHLLALESLGGGKFRQVVVDGLGVTQDETGSVIVDFDADGWKDLLLASSTTAAGGESLLQVYRGGPAGVFEKAPPVRLGARVWLSAVRDVTGDGLLDVLAGRSAHPSLLLLFEGLAPGRVAVRTVLPLNESPLGVSGIDVDGNATSDLVAFSSGALHVVETGPRGFEPPLRAPFAGSAFVDMARGDFDGDGTVEVALADVARNEALLVYFEDGSPSGKMLRHTLRGLSSELEGADLDGDGWSDLVSSDDAQSTLQVLFRPGDEGGSTSVPLDPGGSRPSLAVADLDADGSLDVAAFGRGGGRLFFGDGRGGFPRSRDIDLPYNPSELRAADVDGNGFPELLTFSLTRAVILLDPGAPGPPGSTVIDVRAEILAIEATDVDRDGRGDLLVSSRSTLHVARGEAGGFAAPEEYMVGQSPRGISVQDVNGDGILDAVTADHAGRSLSVLHGKPMPANSFRRGDADSTGTVDLSDAIAVLNALFLGAGPLGCPDAADADDDGALNLTDAVAVLLHLFAGGPAPPPPGPGACGRDPSPDGLEECRAACR